MEATTKKRKEKEKRTTLQPPPKKRIRLLTERHFGIPTCYVRIPRLYDDDDLDETTKKNRALYELLGIEEEELDGSDTGEEGPSSLEDHSKDDSEEVDKKTDAALVMVEKISDSVPCFFEDVMVPEEDIQTWYEGYTLDGQGEDPKAIERRQLHPLCRMIVAHLRRPTSDATAINRAIIYGVTYSGIKQALGLSNFSSIQNIIKKTSMLMGNIPESLVAMKAARQVQRGYKRVRVIPMWSLPFMIACLPKALRQVNRPPCIVAFDVAKDMISVMAKDNNPTEHPLIAELEILEQAITTYSHMKNASILENVTTNGKLADHLEGIKRRMEAMETFYYEMSDNYDVVARAIEDAVVNFEAIEAKLRAQDVKMKAQDSKIDGYERYLCFIHSRLVALETSRGGGIPSAMIPPSRAIPIVPFSGVPLVPLTKTEPAVKRRRSLSEKGKTRGEKIVEIVGLPK